LGIYYSFVEINRDSLFDHPVHVEYSVTSLDLSFVYMQRHNWRPHRFYLRYHHYSPFKVVVERSSRSRTGADFDRCSYYVPGMRDYAVAVLDRLMGRSAKVS